MFESEVFVLCIEFGIELCNVDIVGGEVDLLICYGCGNWC